MKSSDCLQPGNDDKLLLCQFYYNNLRCYCVKSTTPTWDATARAMKALSLNGYYCNISLSIPTKPFNSLPPVIQLNPTQLTNSTPPSQQFNLHLTIQFNSYPAIQVNLTQPYNSLLGWDIFIRNNGLKFIFCINRFLYLIYKGVEFGA